MHVYVRPREDDWLVSPPSLVFEVQTCKFYLERISKAEKLHELEGGRWLRITRVIEAC